MDKNNWQLELDEYIREGEPTRAVKSSAWKTAIGLQAVDGLSTSSYLLATAREHIEGKIDIAVAEKRINSYYEMRSSREQIEQDTKEADVVATRIAALLAERTFQFSPAELKSIHRRLFTGIFSHAGVYRDYNITKKEWVLNGATVYYAAQQSIVETLDYDFAQEKSYNYAGLAFSEAVQHLVRFTAGIWQIHPFGEGNTRTTAVFILKYLQTFGFSVSNEVFASHSWYFRNALVRANYNDLKNGITATTRFLELFFENLLAGATHELKNRFLHIDYKPDFQSANHEPPKCQIGTLNCTLEDMALMRLLVENPRITQRELAVKLGQSDRTIKRKTVKLQELGIIKRENGKRNGKWLVLVQDFS